MALSAKRRAFVEAYLTCWNASEAARRAGYSARSAGSQGHDLLKNPEIQAAIAARLDELKMGADEVLVRLSEQARADVGPYLQITENGTLAIDLVRMQLDGQTHLIRKIKQTQYGIELELYDGQAALIQLGRAHRLFSEGAGSSEDEPLFIQFIEVVRPDDE